MSSKGFKDSHIKHFNRKLLAHDFKNQQVLSHPISAIPAVDIFDAPYIYLKCNLEWYQLVQGWLSHMENIFMWSEALDESYVAITAITRFLRGIDLDIDIRINDCGIEYRVDGGVWQQATGDTIDECVENSQIIGTLTADIATNTANVATNTANVATNTADIATNTADIATNTADIATNTADIAVTDAIAINAQNVANLAFAASQNNAGQILTNITNIDDHETRITTLESGGGGGTGSGIFTFIDAFILDTDGSILLENLDGFQVIYIELDCRSDRAFTIDTLNMKINDDTLNTNYRTNLGGGDDKPEIGVCVADTAPTALFSSHKIRISPCQSGLQTMVDAHNDYRNGNNYQTAVLGYNYEPTDEVQSVEIFASFGDLLTGSRVYAYGIPAEESGVWSAQLTFADISSDPAFLSHPGLAFSANNALQILTEIRPHTGSFIFDFGEVVQLDTLEINSFHNGNHQANDKLWINPLDEELGSIDVEDGLNYGFAVNRNAQVVGFDAVLDGNGESTQFQIFQLTLNGTGTIPSVLQPYEV